MKKAAIVIALAVAVPLLMGATGKGCSSGSGGGQPPVQQAPAQQPGKCVAALGVTHVGGEVIGGMGFRCSGSALLTVKMWLLYDKHGDGSFDLAGPRREVNSVTDTSPALFSVPCQTGWWKVRVQGIETGVGAELEVRGMGDVLRRDLPGRRGG